jgi:hypothetical protein
MNEENLSPEAIARQAIERCRREIAAALGHLETAKEALRRAPPIPLLSDVPVAANEAPGGVARSARAQTYPRRRSRARRRRWQGHALFPQRTKKRRGHK